MSMRMIRIRSAFEAAAVLSLAAVALVGRAPSARAEEVKLRYEGGPAASKLVTPLKVLSRGRRFSFQAGAGAKK